MCEENKAAQHAEHGAAKSSQMETPKAHMGLKPVPQKGFGELFRAERDMSFHLVY